MKMYEQHKKALMNGWQTWNSRSVLSHVMMPEGLGINLGLKDYKEPGLLGLRLSAATLLPNKTGMLRHSRTQKRRTLPLPLTHMLTTIHLLS